MKRIIVIATALILANGICHAQSNIGSTISAENFKYILTPSPTIGQFGKKDTRTKIEYDQDDIDDMHAFAVVKEKTKTYALNTGAKGFFKLGGGSLARRGGNGNSKISMNINGGYQYKILFLGVGWNYFGLFDEDFLNDSELYANVRISYPSRFSPYVEFRVGYRAFFMQTPYYAPEFGFRYGINKKYGLSFGISYENICVKDYNHDPASGRYSHWEKYWEKGFVANLGFDF